MEIARLGKKGQLSIPRSVLKRLGIHGEQPLIVETTPDGAILLRQAAIWPLEIYSEERIEEFAAEDRMTVTEKRRLAQASR